MLEGLLGSINRERVLMFLHCRNEGYAREIARFFNTTLNPIQKQLDRLENNGILTSKSSGKTRMYTLSPRYPFLSELKAMLEKALLFYPTDEQERLIMVRKRPRRKGKPL